MEPKIISGDVFSDNRGLLYYNKNFDLKDVKRFYIIKNIDTIFKRGWQGHKIEQRWYSAINGSFEIKLIKIDEWEYPSKHLEPINLHLDSNKLDILHIPPGYISCIQSLEKDSKLLVMADYLLGEIQDEYRFELDYFKISKK